MSKYEVWIKKWSEEQKSQIKVVAGTFTDYMYAKIFAQAYADSFSAIVEITEYREMGHSTITPTLN